MRKDSNQGTSCENHTGPPQTLDGEIMQVVKMQEGDPRGERSDLEEESLAPDPSRYPCDECGVATNWEYVGSYHKADDQIKHIYRCLTEETNGIGWHCCPGRMHIYE